MIQIRKRKQRGSTMVETALVLLPMLVLILGGMTFAHAVFAYNSVGWIARQATRWASVRGSSSGHPATAGTIEGFARSRAVGLDRRALSVHAAFSPDNNPGSTVTVEVRYTVTPLVPHLFGRSLAVRSTSTANVLQ